VIGAVLPLLAGVLGLLIGSFLNVVVYRLPRGESIVRPGSRCSSCGTPIAPRDNVPLVSWALLRGRARCCGERISVRYPLVELATGAAFAAVAAWLGPSWALPAFAYLAAISIALTLIDLAVHRLPDPIVLPSYLIGGVLLGVASLAAHDGGSVVRAVIGGAALWVLYLVLVLVYPAGMGLGDVKLAGVLGMYLGWLGWAELAVGAFLGFLLGGLSGLGLMLAGRAGRKTMIPFGPFMLAGAWLAIAIAAPVASWYLGAFGV
jgi:leader peptidase (prepilin peptidase) / N-methyltransferase